MKHVSLLFLLILFSAGCTQTTTTSRPHTTATILAVGGRAIIQWDGYRLMVKAKPEGRIEARRMRMAVRSKIDTMSSISLGVDDLGGYIELNSALTQMKIELLITKKAEREMAGFQYSGPVEDAPRLPFPGNGTYRLINKSPE